MRIIIHSKRGETGAEEYFFSTDHCQGVDGKGEGTYPEGFVPITFTLPMNVSARPSLPSGRVTTVKELLSVFFPWAREIPNPDRRFQP